MYSHSGQTRRQDMMGDGRHNTVGTTRSGRSRVERSRSSRSRAERSRSSHSMRSLALNDALRPHASPLFPRLYFMQLLASRLGSYSYFRQLL